MKTEKIIKDTKGVISLLLALLLVPFYSVAGILIEVQRYQSARAGMDDAINASALSVLAQYDDFLLDRFGMLAVGQSEDPSAENGFTGNRNISDTFEKYLKAQDTTDTRSFKLKNVSAEGVYPLADADVLKAQIMDYSTMTLPTVLAADLGASGIQDIIKNIQSSIPFLKFTGVAGDIADTAGKQIDVIEKLEKAQDSVNALNKKTDEYNSSYNKFSDALNKLKETVKDAPAKDAEADAKIEYEKKYKAALEEAQKAKNDYQKTLQSEIKETESLNEKLKDASQTQDEVIDGIVSIGKDAAVAVKDATNLKNNHGEINTLSSQIKDIKEKMEKEDITESEKEKLQEQLDALNKTKADFSDISTAADAATDALDSSQANKILKDYNTKSCGEAISGLTSEMEQLKKLDLENIDIDNIDALTKFENTLHQTDMSKISDAENFNALMSEANQLVNKADSNVSMFSSVAEALNTFMSLSASFDPKLQSAINTEYYKDNYGGLPSQKNRNASEHSLDSKYEEQDRAIAQENLNKLDVVNDITGSGWVDGASGMGDSSSEQKKDAKTQIGKLFNSMKSAMDTIKESVTLLNNLSNLASATGDHIYLVSYLNYMTTNRVDYASKKTLSGKGIKSLNGLADEVAHSQNNLTARFDAKETTGYSFCGAETEYLLMGSMSEKENQKKIFNLLLALRIALNCKAVETNPEARAMCVGLAGVCAAVGIPYKFTEVLARAFLVVAESYVDAILICNGDDGVPMVKGADDIHFCSKGLANIPGRIQKLVTLTDKDKKRLEDSISDVEKKGAVIGGVMSGGTAGNGLSEENKAKGLSIGKNKFCLKYSHYLLLMLMIWNEKDLVKRFADIIQMEETQRSIVNKASVSQKLSGTYPKFDLDKAYTVLRMEVKGDFVSVLPVPTLSKNSVWKLNKIMYRGY